MKKRKLTFSICLDAQLELNIFDDMFYYIHKMSKQQYSGNMNTTSIGGGSSGSVFLNCHTPTLSQKVMRGSIDICK